MIHVPAIGFDLDLHASIRHKSLFAFKLSQLKPFTAFCHKIAKLSQSSSMMSPHPPTIASKFILLEIILDAYLTARSSHWFSEHHRRTRL